MTRYAMTKQELEQDNRLSKHIADARAGTVKPTAWRPAPDAFRAWIDKTALGRETSMYEPERAPAPHVEAGQFDKETEDRFRADAWSSLDAETQAAGLDPDGVGFADAAEAFASAYDQVVADDKAGRAANREQMHQESMARDPGSYGRA
jgi:hypothetical protein